MDLPARKKCLSNIDLFQSFSDLELTLFAQNISEVKLSNGETLFNEGEAGLEMYILLEGEIKIYKDKRFITLINSPDYLGEMAIIENKPRSATAIAGSNLHLLKINVSLFKKYLAKQPRSLVSMMKTLSARIRSDTSLLATEYQRANILIHDMRNRLSAFLLLDLIDAAKLPDDCQGYISIMKSSGRDLAIMMDEALANAKHLKFVRREIKSSINDLILDLKESEFRIHPALADKKIILQLDDTLKDFNFCTVEIRRVLTNLVINAGQASQSCASIKITTASQKESINISIEDHGSGISQKDQQKIFMVNFTTKSYGNGLGLASCKEIIERNHQGTLSFITSESGTTFHVSLPINRDHQKIDQ